MHVAEQPCRCNTWTPIGTSPLGSVQLPFEHSSVADARRFVTCFAAAWGAPQVCETAELLVSETFTNALLHGAPLTGSSLSLIALRWEDMLRVEVHDGADAVPRLCNPDDSDESGRGWFLVDQLADGHGVYRTEFGKAVWFACNAWPSEAKS